MNVNDTEIIYSILNKYNYSKTSNIDDAHVILLMTCAIRDGAEQKIWQRLHKLKAMKTDKRRKLRKNVTVGVIGEKDQNEMASCPQPFIIHFHLRIQGVWLND